MQVAKQLLCPKVLPKKKKMEFMNRKVFEIRGCSPHASSYLGEGTHPPLRLSLWWGGGSQDSHLVRISEGGWQLYILPHEMQGHTDSVIALADSETSDGSILQWWTQLISCKWIREFFPLENSQMDLWKYSFFIWVSSHWIAGNISLEFTICEYYLGLTVKRALKLGSRQITLLS